MKLVGRKTGSKKHVIYFNLLLTNVLFSNIFSEFFLPLKKYSLFLGVPFPYEGFSWVPFHILVSHTALLSIFSSYSPASFVASPPFPCCSCGCSPIISAPCRNAHLPSRGSGLPPILGNILHTIKNKVHPFSGVLKDSRVFLSLISFLIRPLIYLHTNENLSFT